MRKETGVFSFRRGREEIHVCIFLQVEFLICFLHFFLHTRLKMQKVGVAFSFPDSSLQLFIAVLHSLHPSEAEGQRFFSCLAARQLIVAVGPLTSCLVMCFQTHFYAVPGHKYPLYFEKYLECEETVTRQIYCWVFLLFRHVNKMPFWFKETWTRECLDTIAIIPWSWPRVSFCINEGSSLFAPVRQQHNQQAIKF